MTVEEAYQAYGGMQTETLVNDSLVYIVRRIYQSDDEMYFRIFRVLNPHINWLSMEPGITLTYIPPEVISTTLF